MFAIYLIVSMKKYSIYEQWLYEQGPPLTNMECPIVYPVHRMHALHIRFGGTDQYGGCNSGTNEYRCLSVKFYNFFLILLLTAFTIAGRSIWLKR